MKLPQLSLRDLFWLVLVCALAVAWWLERRDLQSQVEKLKSGTLVRVEGSVTAIDQKRLLAEIGLGTDDGIRNGDVIQVSRGTLEIGQVIVREVNSDRSVGAITFERRAMQKGDKVVLSVSPADWSSRVRLGGFGLSEDKRTLPMTAKTKQHP